MAENKETGKDLKEIATTMADSIAEAMNKHMPRKMSAGEYARKYGKKVRLTRTCYQNGYGIDNTRLTDEETELLNKLVRPGKYMDRKVEVIVRPEPDNTLEIRYSDKRVDQRIELSHYFRSFKELLTKLIAEQTLAQEEEKARRER